MKSAVVDTNIFISAVFWKGTPGRVIEIFAAQQLILMLSDDILAELEQKLKNKKFAVDLINTGKTAEKLVDDFRQLAEIVVPADVPEDAIRDKKDRIILACALGGKADIIVSGDKDLTAVKAYQGIPIVTPAEFLAIVNSPDKPASDESQNE
jgi:uncharacterized protein